MKHRFKDKRLMQSFLLFGMICLALPLFSASLCYQEFANQSSVSDGSCALNYSGNYYTSVSYNTDEDIDGNWDSGTSCSGNTGVAFRLENYALPSIPREELRGAVIQLKTYQGIFNVTIYMNHSCLDPSVILLKLRDDGNCESPFSGGTMYDPMSLGCENNNTFVGLYYSDPTCVGLCDIIYPEEPPPEWYYSCATDCAIGTIYEMGVYWILADEEIPQEPEQETGFTTSGQAIYEIMDSSGAGLGIFLQFMGLALPSLLIILGLIGVIVLIGYLLANLIKQSMVKSK